MNDFLFKFFQGLFDEAKPEEIPRIVNELTTTGIATFRLPIPTNQSRWGLAGTQTLYHLTSTVNVDETSSAISLRGVYDEQREAFWVSKGNTLIKITGAPFILAKRYAYRPNHVKKLSGVEAEQRAKLFQMHMNKIANYLDLAEVSGLYTEIHAPESDTAFLKAYTAIPYQ